MKKRGQSQVISTVLLILLAIVAIGLVMGFVIPFIKDKISSGDCLDVAGKIELVNNPDYTCYDLTKSSLRVQIHILDISDLIRGFSIESGGASSKSVKIVNGTNHPDVSMYDGGSANETIPGDNEARTYVINNTQQPNSIEVYPILKTGKICGSSDVMVNIDNCFISS